MNTKRCPWLVGSLSAIVILGLAVPGLAAELPPTVLWNVTSVAGGSVAVGPDGHLVVVGTVCDPANTQCNIRVVKHDASTGAPIWSVTLASLTSDGSGQVAIGADGHAVVTGNTCGNTGVGCDYRIAKVDGATGALLWSVTFSDLGWDLAGPVAIGSDGNPVFTGVTCLTDFSVCDAPIVKLSGATGAVLWNTTYPAGEEAEWIAVGPDGHPVVSVFRCVGCGRVVKYHGLTGAVLWDVPFNASQGLGYSGGVAVGSDGHPVVTGASGRPPDFSIYSASDFRTVKYDSATGAELWNVAFDLGQYNEAYSIAIGGDGNPIIEGISCATGPEDCVGRTLKFDVATGALMWTFAGPAGPLAMGLDGDPVQTHETCTEDSCDVSMTKYLIQHDTPAGASVAVALNGGTGAGDGVSVTFTSVGTAGSTTLTASATGPTPPAGFTLSAPPIFYDVATTAAFSGTVQVCINYTNRSVPAPETDLRLLHFQSGSWVDVTSSLDTVTNVICGQVTSLSPFVIAKAGSPLSSLGPANVWIGLKNSDDVGIRFDLRAEVYRNGTQLVGSGEATSVAGGSSGFNNARLDTIALAPIPGVTFSPGETLSIKLLVRNACTGSGKNSGTARLWFSDSAATSRFDATIGNPQTYFLADGFALASGPGPGPKKTIDVAAGAKCSAFKPFGSWSVTLP